MFYFDEINNKKILKSDYLSDEMVFHMFTTRETVITPKDLKNLENLSKNNLECLSNYLSIDKENIIIPEQTHSCNIAIARKNGIYKNTDSLIIKERDIAILLNFADCTPVIIYDEVNNIGAIAHAGWRGTASSIVTKTIEKMSNMFNTKPENLIALVGPAISSNNYQVDEDVFFKLKNSLKKEYEDYFTKNDQTKKYNVDIKTINKHQLEELGVSRIDMCEYCTYDSVDVFFSYRRENGITARHSAILKLK